MRFPSIKHVRAALVNANKNTQPSKPGDFEDDGDVPVRLQVYEDGQWALRVGSSDYDQDHRGFWGASSVPGSTRRFNATDTAKDLLSQCRSACAESMPAPCERCKHSCLDAKACVAHCTGDPMSPGDRLCVVCDRSRIAEAEQAPIRVRVKLG